MGNSSKISSKEYTVRVESLERICYYRHNSELPLKWDCLFVLPDWIKVWMSEFGASTELYPCSVRQGEDLIGIAPLLVQGEKALLIGDTDVCDYLDFIVAPGKGLDFFSALLDHLDQEGITYLDLKALRPDSMALTELADLARKRKCEVASNLLDISLELELPATWDEYLLMLNGKQRHEIRRKFRRIHEVGDVHYRVVEDIEEIRNEMDTFLALFESSRVDKAAFMTDRMASYFRSLAEVMAAAKMLKLYLLDLNRTTVAAAMCFDYNSTVYLYNSGFDRRFSSLSVGLLCKVFSIKDSIQNSRKKYDFLKGAEAYKYHLGGKEIPLHRCQIQLRS